MILLFILILLQNLILITLMIKNDCYIVAIEIRRINIIKYKHSINKLVSRNRILIF